MRFSIDFLKWDSNFFGLRIGKVDCDLLNDISQWNLIEKTNFDLIYCFVKSSDREKCDTIEQYGAKLVDEKVIFNKKLSEPVQKQENIRSFNGPAIHPKLYELARASGYHSRFKTDLNFKEGCFERLYDTWLEKSLNKQLADETFIFEENKVIKGFVTLKMTSKSGLIGLISVDKEFRGQGIGSRMNQHCEYILFQNNVFHLKVATQKANKEAMKFYTRNNYSIDKAINIYHLWRS